MNAESKLMTVMEVSKTLQISSNSIYYYISIGEIPYLKMGKHIRLEYSEVINFMKRRAEQERAGKKHDFLLQSSALFAEDECSFTTEYGNEIEDESET